jgi:hypothetical protein
VVFNAFGVTGQRRVDGDVAAFSKEKERIGDSSLMSFFRVFRVFRDF